jgi:hypothetical protein
MAWRLSDFAEQYRLLPDSQMKNWQNQLTETALELLVEQIYTVWELNKHIASVLLLDISEAFDTVNHI